NGEALAIGGQLSPRRGRSEDRKGRGFNAGVRTALSFARRLVTPQSFRSSCDRYVLKALRALLRRTRSRPSRRRLGPSVDKQQGSRKGTRRSFDEKLRSRRKLRRAFARNPRSRRRLRRSLDQKPRSVREMRGSFNEKPRSRRRSRRSFDESSPPEHAGTGA